MKNDSAGYVVGLICFIILGVLLTNSGSNNIPKNGPQFEVGDCVVDSTLEKWDEDFYIARIGEVGHHHYRVQAYARGAWRYIGSVSFTKQDQLKKVECPTEKKETRCGIDKICIVTGGE